MGVIMFYSARTSIPPLLKAFGLLVFAVLIAISATASAQDRRQNAPGEFDFYVLSLSWSPSFCEQASERGDGGRSQMQCGGRPYSFVVHGLWPQYEQGFPDYCQRPAPRLDRNIVSSMLDLMPARAGDDAADQGRLRRTKGAPAVIAGRASDQAIQHVFRVVMDCFAPLAMTW